MYNNLKLGNNIWAFRIAELNKAPITLSGIQLTKVKNGSGVLEELLATWIKDFKSEQIYNYLWGTRFGQPVQIGLNIGAGVIDLLKTPVSEYSKGGNILKGEFVLSAL